MSVQDTISYHRSVLDIQISFLFYMENYEKDKYKFVQNLRIFPQHRKRNMEKLQFRYDCKSNFIYPLHFGTNSNLIHIYGKM